MPSSSNHNINTIKYALTELRFILLKKTFVYLNMQDIRQIARFVLTTCAPVQIKRVQTFMSIRRFSRYNRVKVVREFSSGLIYLTV
jgi:hypothetical protein